MTHDTTGTRTSTKTTTNPDRPGSARRPLVGRSRQSHTIGPLTDLEAAWHELHDANTDGWFVGPTTHEEHRHEWTMYAFDTRERPKAGRRSRERTAVAQSELEVGREMVRCLGLIAEGQGPGLALRRLGQVLQSHPDWHQVTAALMAAFDACHHEGGLSGALDPLQPRLSALSLVAREVSH